MPIAAREARGACAARGRRERSGLSVQQLSRSLPREVFVSEQASGTTASQGLRVLQIMEVTDLI